MFHKLNVLDDIKPEPDRLFNQTSPSSKDLNYDDCITVALGTRQLQQQNCHNNQFSNVKEESKSHKSKNQNSLKQHSHQQVQSSAKELQSNTNSTMNINNLNQRVIQGSMARSTTNPQICPQHSTHQTNQISSHLPATSSTSLTSKSAIANETSTFASSAKQLFNNKPLRTSSNSTTMTVMQTNPSSSSSSSHSPSNGDDFTKQTHSSSRHQKQQQDHQQDKETNEVVTNVTKEELDNDFKGVKEVLELETISSLKEDIPAELSFLIQQQAFCMAKMNYLDRQIRELKDSKQQLSTNPYHQHSVQNQHHHHSHPQQQHQQCQYHQHPNISSTLVNQNNFPTSGGRISTVPATNAISNNPTTTLKNGNFIPSDDSGGEYSRATTSDDDELSSLLDQIAKSVKPERNLNQNGASLHQPQQQLHHLQQQQQLQHQRANYSAISNQPQQYAIINPNQLHHHHHQAVPVFVMSSPIAVAHPSSISSTVLPGVHFQPEPRYNQYYEDFYVHNNPTSTLHRHNGAVRSSQQFDRDSSISAIEQLVSQKEKRQIKSQLKSADNWLKMRSSAGLCNSNDNNFSNVSNSKGPISEDVSGSVIERNLPASSSVAILASDSSNSVSGENRSQ